MTGMFASDVNSYSNSTCFAGGSPTWATRLRQAGYYCWATGKMDLTQGVDFGFDEYETEHEHSRNPDITSLFRTPVGYRVDMRSSVDGAFKDRPHRDQERVNNALDFLRRQAPKLRQPWAAYVGLTLPHPVFVAQRKFEALYPPEKMPLPNIPEGHLEQLHIPFQVLRDFNRISTPIPVQRIRRARAAYFGMITELDEYLGQLLDELDKLNMRENTLVIYTSDHGEMLGEHGMWFKNNLLENAARVPLIVAGPGFGPGQMIDTPVSHADLTPTLLEVAGAPTGTGLRGHSLAGLARKEFQTHPGYAFSESHSEGNCTGSFMIRKGDWKYMYFTWYGNLLFHLKSDPGEFQNLSGQPDYKEIEQGLHSILTSLVDPDAVTRRAFDEHDKQLRTMIQQRTARQFYDLLVKRLGPGQAASLTYHHYHQA
jgi:choline-sulfatase